MRARRLQIAGVVASGFAATLSACANEDPARLVIRNVSVIDVVSGAVHDETNIVIRGEAIDYIGHDTVSAEQTIDGTGLWAMPGFWDMHVHISDTAFFPLFVSNGVVGVRDMGGAADQPSDGCESIDIAVLRSWRGEIESGERIGPRMVLAGPVLSATDEPRVLSAGTPESARESVAKLHAMDADFVKVYEGIPHDAFVALADEARKLGLPVAGHVSEETLTVLDAIELGQRSIEHVRSHLLLCFAKTPAEREALYVSDRWDANDRHWAKRHVASCPEVWNRLRDTDVWLTPTLAVQETMLTGGEPGFDTDARRVDLPQSIRDAVVSRSRDLRRRTQPERREAMNWNGFVDRLVYRALQEGAALLAGSDAACEGVIPGHGLHRELELLVGAGASPLRALQSTTVEPARYLDRAGDMGQIRAGFVADLVLLRSNPLIDISAVVDIEAVIIGGRIVHVADRQ